MIRNQWYAVLESKELKKGKILGVTRLGEKLVFWRDKDNKIICLKDKCAHRGAKLSIGQICDKGETIECPFHGLRYDKTGKCTIIPANGKNTLVPERFKVNSYPIQEFRDFIWIWWGEPRRNYPPLPFFEDIDERFAFKTYTEVWPVHYSRAIENQLDAVHLPFVHYNTIGRGYRTIVHGPLVIEDENKNGFKAYVRNDKDDGKIKPLKPAEFPEDWKVFYIQFRFPHLWQNHLSEKFRIFIAFVPIDEKNTLFYMRLYQRVIKIPILRHFFMWLANKFNVVILHQDRRVVITQQPIKSQLKMGENLIQGDLPIITYRRRREELLNQNNQE